jgi:hypothetical protein
VGVRDDEYDDESGRQYQQQQPRPPPARPLLALGPAEVDDIELDLLVPHPAIMNLRAAYWRP